MIRYSQSACQPSRRCSQRCILFSQTVPWTKSSNIHSLAFQRSPTASHIASRWPSPLYYTEPTRMFSPFMRINPYKLCSGTTFRSFYLKNHVTSQPVFTLSRLTSWSKSEITAINSIPGKFSQRTSMGVFRFVSPIFWYRSFSVSAWKKFKAKCFFLFNVSEVNALSEKSTELPWLETQHDTTDHFIAIKTI